MNDTRDTGDDWSITLTGRCRSSSVGFAGHDRRVHVSHQQHLNGMTHKQQEYRQKSGHGAVATVTMLHGRGMFTCANSHKHTHAVH